MNGFIRRMTGSGIVVDGFVRAQSRAWGSLAAALHEVVAMLNPSVVVVVVVLRAGLLDYPKVGGVEREPGVVRASFEPVSEVYLSLVLSTPCPVLQEAPGRRDEVGVDGVFHGH